MAKPKRDLFIVNGKQTIYIQNRDTAGSSVLKKDYLQIVWANSTEDVLDKINNEEIKLSNALSSELSCEVKVTLNDLNVSKAID
jgi:hypothetical protein